MDCTVLAVAATGMCYTGDEASKEHHLHAAFIDEASELQGSENHMHDMKSANSLSVCELLELLLGGVS